MANWLNLSKEEQLNLFNQLSAKTGLPAFAIEKDAWVSLVLRMLFLSEISKHLIFKGGTSLSKAYQLIERFSEDIDFAISREYLEFSDELSKGEIRKLRRASHYFSSSVLPLILQRQFSEYGIAENVYTIEVPNIQVSDQDPEIVLVNYRSVFEELAYLKSSVRVEIGARSLIEPFENRSIQSIVDENYPNADFKENSFEVSTVIPEKTLFEKMILLHEEFQKQPDEIKSHRMSRHLYDILQIARTPFGERAFNRPELFKTICLHRARFTPTRNINYQNLTIASLNFIPPSAVLNNYRNDYREMQDTMIYGESLDFDLLLEELKNITTKI